MPRKPWRRRNRGMALSRLSPGQLAFLKDDPSDCVGFERDYVFWCLCNGMAGLDGDPEPRDLWDKYRGDFLPEFIEKNPGRRPCGWWLFDAPRFPHQGSRWFWEGTLPEPRRRIRGKGELHGGLVPYSYYGIWQHWDPKTLDPSDPLIFESQAAYLDRLGLLTDTERKALEKQPELWDSEVMENDEKADQARVAE